MSRIWPALIALLLLVAAAAAYLARGSRGARSEVPVPRVPETRSPSFDVRHLTFACVDVEGRRRSLVWRFRARGDDVYFAPGLHFGAPEPSRYHISLHRDRRCHRTFDRTFFSSWFGRLGLHSRQTRHWIRPSTPPEGSTRVYLVAVLPDPNGHSAPVAELNLDQIMPPPTAGNCLALELAYSHVPPERFRAPGGQVLGNLVLRSGERVYFVAHEVAFDATSYHIPATVSEGRLLQDPGAPLPSHVRTVLFNDVDEGAEGIPQAIDVAAAIDALTRTASTFVPGKMLPPR